MKYAMEVSGMQTTITTLESAPTLSDFVAQVKEEEQSVELHTVTASSLTLGENGLLSVKGSDLTGEYPITAETRNDLATQVKVPAQFFDDCNLDLQSFIYNKRNKQKIPPEEPLQVLIKKDVVKGVRNRSSLYVPRFPLIEAIANSVPPSTRTDQLKVINYAWNGTADICVISPSATCMPIKGDIVALGVAVMEDRQRQVQFHSAAYRCYCQNGALMQICRDDARLLRRPSDNSKRQQDFLKEIQRLARMAWHQWTENAENLMKLTTLPIYQERYDELRERLRRPPFSLSAGVANQVIHRLNMEAEGHTGGPTGWDLWNSLSYLAAHDASLSYSQKRRLRLGAGEVTQCKSRTCSACYSTVFN